MVNFVNVLVYSFSEVHFDLSFGLLQILARKSTFGQVSGKST